MEKNSKFYPFLSFFCVLAIPDIFRRPFQVHTTISLLTNPISLYVLPFSFVTSLIRILLSSQHLLPPPGIWIAKKLLHMLQQCFPNCGLWQASWNKGVSSPSSFQMPRSREKAKCALNSSLELFSYEQLAHVIQLLTDKK